MPSLQDELMKSLSSYETGRELEISRNEKGEAVIGPSQEAVMRITKLRSPMRQAEPQTFAETEKEFGPALAGIATGPAVGAAEVVDLGLGLVKGAYKAAFPDADKGRFESFMQTLGDQFESGYGEGARSFILDMGKRAGYDEEQLKVMDEGITAGSFFGYGGAGKAAIKAAPKAASALGDAVEGAGDAAKARMADTDGSVTLTSGVDPDPAIAALGDAVKAARAKYEASPNDPNARREYLDARHERDAQLSSMPVEEKLETDVNYRMMHQPTTPQNGAARLDDMTGGGTVFPDDVYGGDAVRLYGGNNPADQESANIIQSVRGNPEAEVTIYRGVPKDVDTINPGDWVTLSKKYADDHAEGGYGQMGDEAGKVISQKVKVKDVYSDGNDLNEFGYFPEDIAETNVAKLEPPTETEPGIIAFHGSGANFDEFQVKYIGTGEGAQAYGYGLYFTDSEDIAKFYKNMMQKSVDIDGKPYIRGNNINDELVDPDIADDLGAKNGDLEAAIKSSEEFLQEMIADDNVNAINSTRKELEKLKELRGRVTVKDQEGKLYKVGLAPKLDELLDYDLPLSQQPKILELIDDVHGDPEIIIKQVGLDPATATGGDFVKALGGIGQEQGAKAASEFLAKAGIPGIKFFSGNTRNIAGGKFIDVAETTDGFRARVAVDNRAGGLGGSGRVVTTSQPYKTKQQALDWADEAIKNKESNYVIFDDKMIKILEKYGIVGPVAITGVAATQQEGKSDGTGA